MQTNISPAVISEMKIAKNFLNEQIKSSKAIPIGDFLHIIVLTSTLAGGILINNLVDPCERCECVRLY